MPTVVQRLVKLKLKASCHRASIFTQAENKTPKARPNLGWSYYDRR